MPVISSAFVANTLQPHFEKKLLAKAIQETRLLEYAQLAELAPRLGANTITFFRPEAANLKAVGAPQVLAEGVPPAPRRGISYTPVTCTLEQIGQVAEATDVADNIGLFDYVNNAIDLMGEEFALDVETRLRDPLAHPATGLTKRYGQGLADFAGLAAATNALGAIVPSDILDAMTRLKLNRAPKIDGWYVAYLCPQVTRDVINNQEFREVVRNEHANKIFKGEIGEYYGCKITEGTVPFTEQDVEGTYDDTYDPASVINPAGLVYTNFVLGKGAFGAVNMKKAGSSMRKPTIIVNDKPDKSDPLNQKILVGWKAYWKNIILNAAWGIALRTKSEFV